MSGLFLSASCFQAHFCSRTSFLFISEGHPIVQARHTRTHPSADGHLGLSQLLTTVASAAVNIHFQDLVRTPVFRFCGAYT